MQTFSELQQSKPYAQYIQRLGWQVVPVDSVTMFTKRIPFLGVIAKIHRPRTLPSLTTLLPVLRKHRIKIIAVEPPAYQDQQTFSAWINQLSSHVRINQSPFLPTKTIRIDLTLPEKTIFAQFTEAKRRGVRRAIKHGVTVHTSMDIKQLIAIKNKSAGLFGFITTTGINHLWDNFAPNHAAILLAYRPTQQKNQKMNVLQNAIAQMNEQIIGGVLLLFWNTIGYYWVAGATKQGKKLFAPTILMWEAMKLSKARGMKLFDLVGVWDERLPRLYRDWKGFTKFKEGFGGKTIYYPVASRAIINMPHP